MTTIDGFTFDHAALPPKNIDALVAAAIGHKMRNEAASRVRSKLLSEARSAKRANGGGEKAELTEDEKRAVKFNVEDPAHKALYLEAQKDIHSTITTGSIGESAARGPAKSEEERRCDAYCAKMVLAAIQTPKHKLWWENDKPIKGKVPKASQLFSFADGKSRTFGEMCEAYYRVNAASVDKTVKAQIEAERRAAEKSALEGEKDELGF